ncbi:MAG: phosphotransferase [Gammaproteobacteria bacterium]|nr:phosphotransferase [Gammaproteobacteria bacterium]
MIELLAEDPGGVSDHIRTLGWIGANEAITGLQSAGEGNMNRTLRAMVGARSIILKQSVPFVARYPEIPAPVDRIDIEARFYHAIAAEPELSMHVPAVIGYDPDNHLLCLEDLGVAQDFTHLYDRRAVEDSRHQQHLKTLIGWLSRLHALPVTQERLPDRLDNSAMRELNHAHIFEIPLDPNNGLSLRPGLADAASEYATDTALRDTAGRLGELYLGRTSVESGEVLLHGDFYPGSWLQHPNIGATIIDPEFAFLGPPEFDVGVLLAHLTMCGYQPPELTALLRSYVTPPGFDQNLARQFSGIEIIRRLLGVAQLPLSADNATRIHWLSTAREWLMHTQGRP